MPPLSAASLSRWLGYALLLAGAVGVFLLIDVAGSHLTAPHPALAPEAAPAATGGKPDALVHVLLALAAVLVTGRLLSVLFRFIGQPPVIGEVVGGILLGPSFLGRVWPEAGAFLLPPSVAPYLGVVAQLGVILYMFLVGLELNPAVLRERAHATVTISNTSIVVPFLLGRPWPCCCILGSPAATCPSPASPCSLAWPRPSPPFRCWLAS